MKSVAAVLSAIVLVGCIGDARADGYPPFYGYSPYLGRPAVYFTPDSDVQQATTMINGREETRTYYRGGPFYRLQPVSSRTHYYPRRHGRRVVVRARG